MGLYGSYIRRVTAQRCKVHLIFMIERNSVQKAVPELVALHFLGEAHFLAD
jgi:hypothetical protein